MFGRSSEVRGLERFKAKLKTLEAHVAQQMEVVHMAEVPRLQREVVSLVPVDTGNLRDLLSSREAVQHQEDEFRRATVWRFGFVTSRLKKEGWYALFVEFGTRGYPAGGKRFGGRSKKTGRAYFRKIRRNVPARPARPFMRMGFARWLPRYRKWRQVAMTEALARFTAGDYAGDV